MTDALHWFIPARRAVVRGPTSYRDLIRAWRTQLSTHAEALRRWYPPLSADGVDAGIEAIESWEGAFFSATLAAARNDLQTHNRASVHFKPRLWKGAYRVLCESAAGPNEPGPTIFEPSQSEDPKLVLTDKREIHNADAPLLTGDVVELPLHKFLAVAGLGEYGRRPRFDQVEFDPEGSYLLGTSLKSQVPLHDNLLAMRFQLILGCYLGAFYHPEPVFKSETRAPTAKVSGPVAAVVPEPPALERLRADIERVLGQAREVRRPYEEVREVPGFEDAVPEPVREDLGRLFESKDPTRLGPFLERLRAAIRDPISRDSRRERDRLNQLHMLVSARLQMLVTSIRELIDSEEWAAYEHLGPDIERSHRVQLRRMTKLRMPCRGGRYCPSYHRWNEVSEVVAALVAKREALEGAAAASATRRGRAARQRAAGGGTSIYARGMVYAGTLFSGAGPGRGRARWAPSEEAWHFKCYRWCRDGDRYPAMNLPFKTGLKNFVPGLPVTPGSVCSDTTLWLSNFMIRNRSAGQWGRGSVAASMRKATSAPLSAYFEYIPAKEAAKEAPHISRDDRLAALETLVPRVEALYARVHGDTAFWVQDLRWAQGQLPWSALDETHRSNLERTANAWRGPSPRHRKKVPPPGWFFWSAATCYKDRTAFNAPIEALHDRLMASAKAFSDGLEAAIDSPEWAAFDGEGGSFKGKYVEGPRTDLAGMAPLGFLSDRRAHKRRRRTLARAIAVIRARLARKLRRLRWLREHPQHVQEQRGGAVDLSGFMRDVNTVTYSGHEWAVVKLREHAELLNAELRPTAGFLAAFHPLSGAPFPIEVDGGQLYVFEQGSGLSRPKGVKPHWFGAAPFRWHAVRNNEFTFQISKSGHRVRFGETSRRRRRILNAITRLRADVLLPEHQHGPFRPILIQPTSRPRDRSKRPAWDAAMSRMVTHGLDMYASRALPFPTLLEVRGAFAEYEEVMKQVVEFG